MNHYCLGEDLDAVTWPYQVPSMVEYSDKKFSGKYKHSQRTDITDLEVCWSLKVLLNLFIIILCAFCLISKLSCCLSFRATVIIKLLLTLSHISKECKNLCLSKSYCDGVVSVPDKCVIFQRTSQDPGMLPLASKVGKTAWRKECTGGPISIHWNVMNCAIDMLVHV